jgi:hypothetical protein
MSGTAHGDDIELYLIGIELGEWEHKKILVSPGSFSTIMLLSRCFFLEQFRLIGSSYSTELAAVVYLNTCNRHLSRCQPRRKNNTVYGHGRTELNNITFDQVW